MKIKDLFRRRQEEPEILASQEQYEPDNSVSAAEMAAEIVNLGVESGDLVHVNQRLDSLNSATDAAVCYVFEPESSIGLKCWVGLGILLSVGFLYVLFVSLGAAVFSAQFRAYGIIGAVISIAALAFNVYSILLCLKRIRFLNRYGKYYNLLRHKSVEVVEDLAGYVHIPQKTVLQDLSSAVEMNLLPQARFGTDQMILLLSDRAYEKYMSDQAAYDRYYMQLLEEHRRILDRPPEVQQLLDLGDQYVKKIRADNDLIKDKVISQKLYRMEAIVAAIFYEVDIDPTQADKLGLLLSYYLPTTEKLLESYIEMTEKSVQGNTSRKMRKEIGDSIDKINEAFERILDRFYEEKEVDIAGDIAAMNVAMEQEDHLEGLPDEV